MRPGFGGGSLVWICRHGTSRAEVIVHQSVARGKGGMARELSSVEIGVCDGRVAVGA